VALIVAILTGCGTTRHETSAVGPGGNGSASSSTTPATAAASPTKVAHPIPTAPNCGGGAYKPATLLIVCASGDAAVMATGVTWRSWGATDAVGSGTVHVVLHGQRAAWPATLNLEGVTNGAAGPEFSQLIVTWIGSSPTGSPRVSYHLQPGG
jgi:hypothetical protein